jgi:hypothetical protein
MLRAQNEHGGEGLAEMAAWLQATSAAIDPSQVHIAVELPHGRDAAAMASATLRTVPRCFRLLALADPVVIELRAWSRNAEDPRCWTQGSKALLVV